MRHARRFVLRASPARRETRLLTHSASVPRWAAGDACTARRYGAKAPPPAAAQGTGHRARTAHHTRQRSADAYSPSCRRPPSGALARPGRHCQGPATEPARRPGPCSLTPPDLLATSAPGSCSGSCSSASAAGARR
uniref:Uncharacterized protein n=1 Tax=Oryza sativa subsp. japonica TaxID=39947 RepID=Q6YX70_ORYSJ|nr:hypothetical protein [Oryza sativa Japonica Group]